MRLTLLYTLLLFSISGLTQTVVRFINPETKEPVCGIYSKIFKNETTFENCGGSNKEGISRLRIRNVDTNAKYYFSFNYTKYKPIWHEIDLNNRDTLIVKLIKEDYYYDRSDSIFSSQGCSSRSYLNYYPRCPRTLEDLPKDIANKLKQHLIERIGVKDYNKTRLIGGQIIDVDYLQSINEKTAYSLCFCYSNLDAGIGMYTSKIKLDIEGNILEEIGLPRFVGVQSSMEFVPYTEIIKKVRQNKKYQDIRLKAEMAYEAKENILIWKFINEIFEDNGTYIRNESIYNAHNGKFLRIDTQKGEWVE